MWRERTLIVWFVCAFLLQLAAGRPLVRNIRSAHEFDRLLKKHGEETGLPVVVDFYSDSCGPCRMMAPIFKKVAQQFLDKAVFCKVDTATQYELSSRYQVRSLPTFAYFVGQKKVHQSVGGIGEHGLVSDVQKVIRDAEYDNVKLTFESLVDYYQTTVKDASKTETDIRGVYQKCVDMTKSSECVGAAAQQLARRLRKKYSKMPAMVPRFTPEDQQAKASKEGGADGSNNNAKANKSEKSSSSSSARSNKPNLHLASLEQLQEELERRLDEARDAAVDAEDADEDELNPDFHRWSASMFPERVVVVGGGPAGWAAAIYAARAGLQPLVVCPSMGGQLQGKGVDVENYPGLLNQTGPALVASMRQQALHFGAFVEDDIVTSIEPSADGGPLVVHTNSTGRIETHTVVIATGAESNWLGVPGEWELRGGGVSSCATCDGFLYAGRTVVVVGGGDTAMEDALVLARTSERVVLVHRRDQFRASKVLADRVLQHPKITVRWNTTVQEVKGTNVDSAAGGASATEDDEEMDLDQMPQQQVVSGVKVRNVATGEETKIACDALFVAIGHTPSTSFLQGVVEFDPTHPGYLKTVQGSTQTSVPGIFAAGDVADAVYRQAITSAGSGAAAALDAERYLSEHGLGNEQAEWEAELLAELTVGDASRNAEEDEPYNIYQDVGGRRPRGEGRAESVRVEL